MTDRRVMVMDNNNDLIEIISNALMPYGYETQLVEAGENGIHIVKSLRPEAVFVAAEQSDKSRLALCSKAKKVAGSQIPVILISSNIPKSDLDLHGKQRYHADAYLTLKDFFNGEFVEKVSTLIDLKPVEQVDTVPFSDPSLPNAAKKRFVDQSDKRLDATSEALSGNETFEKPLDALDDEPFWLDELYKKIISDDTSDKGNDLSQAENDVDRYIPEESYTDEDLEQRLREQEIEIAGLQAKIEETQREARSSPFSRDYLNLREGLARKERQIVQLTEKLGKYRSKALTGDERLRDLAKRMFNLKTELEQSQAREKELSLRHETIHTELAKLSTTVNESKKHYDAIIDKINREHEVSVKKLSEKHKETVVSLKKQVQQEKINAKAFRESEYQKKLDKIQIEHDAIIDKINRKHEVSVEELSEKHKETVVSLKKQVQQEKINAKAFRESEYQKKFDKIQIEHDAMIDSLREQIEKEKTKAANAAESKWQKRIEKQQREYDESIAQLKKAQKNELKSFKSGVGGMQDILDAEINALMAEHKAIVDSLKEEHHATIASLKKQIEKEKEKEKAKFKAILDSHQEFEKLHKGHNDLIPKLKKEHAEEVKRLNAELKKTIKKYQEELKTLDKKYKQDLHDLDKKYSSEIGGIKKEKNTEIDDLKKKAARDAEKSAEILAEEQKAHKETRIRLESKLVEKLVANAKQGSI